MIFGEEYLSRSFFQIYVKFPNPLVFFLPPPPPPPSPLIVLFINLRLAVMSRKSSILSIDLFKVVFIIVTLYHKTPIVSISGSAYKLRTPKDQLHLTHCTGLII